MQRQIQKAFESRQRRLKAGATALKYFNWRERRQRVHAVHADVIDHLDEYLDQFIAKIRRIEIVIHRAVNTAEAIKILK